MASETMAQALRNANAKAPTSDVIDVPPMAREILEKYSLISSEEVATHVVEIVRFLRSPWSHSTLMIVLSYK